MVISPLLHIRPEIQFEPKCCPWLCMQVPVRIGNLITLASFCGTWIRFPLTATGSILASSCSKVQLFVRGISMTPSRMTCATCTPCGPNSRARDCANALSANLPEAKAENVAEPFRLAVAPVNIKVGGCFNVASLALRRSGRVLWAKRKPPFLCTGQHGKWYIVDRGTNP